MRPKLILVLLLTTVLNIGCGEKEAENKMIIVKNPLDVARAFETVEIDLRPLVEDTADAKSITYGIFDSETKKEITSQTVDANGDGIPDLLLFQPQIDALAERSFEVVVLHNSTASDSIPACFSRFVPERTDDYAWENNRVAFRTYGPTAQKLAEDQVKGGTLSSGIDAWLKRVDYPIINKWYKEELSGEVSYHKDTGEGLDNFHVGPSRGVGGVAKKVDSTYYTSKNFTSWKNLYNGPIRTSFILTYADWDADGNTISDEKHISLDYGSNLSRFEVSLKGTDTVSAGLTLHEKDGIVGVDQEEGWVTYWEPHDDSELGMAIVVPNNMMIGYERYETDVKDESNLFAHLKVDQQKVVYYAGFGWKKSNQFANKEEWQSYVSTFSRKLNNPMIVEVR